MATRKKGVKNIENDKLSLNVRDDLFEKWIIRDWFVSGVEWASLKRIYINLFSSLYDDLSDRYNAKKRDELFLNFINVVFPTILDVYKWHESEKVNQDIGLLKALETIPLCDWYIRLLMSYTSKF
jgi:hypothetical protein